MVLGSIFNSDSLAGTGRQEFNFTCTPKNGANYTGTPRNGAYYTGTPKKGEN